MSICFLLLQKPHDDDNKAQRLAPFLYPCKPDVELSHTILRTFGTEHELRFVLCVSFHTFMVMLGILLFWGI